MAGREVRVGGLGVGKTWKTGSVRTVFVRGYLFARYPCVLAVAVSVWLLEVKAWGDMLLFGSVKIFLWYGQLSALSTMNVYGAFHSGVALDTSLIVNKTPPSLRSGGSWAREV